MKAFTVAQVARDLQVDPDTVYRLIRSGKLRAFKVGSDWRITERALEEFIRKNTFSPLSYEARGRVPGNAEKQRASRAKVNWAKRIEGILWRGKEREIATMEDRVKESQKRQLLALSGSGSGYLPRPRFTAGASFFRDRTRRSSWLTR